MIYRQDQPLSKEKLAGIRPKSVRIPTVLQRVGSDLLMTGLLVLVSPIILLAAAFVWFIGAVQLALSVMTVVGSAVWAGYSMFLRRSSRPSPRLVPGSSPPRSKCYTTSDLWGIFKESPYSSSHTRKFLKFMEEQERPKSKSSRPKKFKMSLTLDETTAINDTWLKCNDRGGGRVSIMSNPLRPLRQRTGTLEAVSGL